MVLETSSIFTSSPSPPTSPSVQDVLDVKNFFQSPLVNSPGGIPLPNEIVDMIIDFAEYWPSTIVNTRQECSVRALDHPGDLLCLRSFPLGYMPRERDLNMTGGENGAPQENTIPLPLRYVEAPRSGETTRLLQSWAAESRSRGRHPCRKIVFTIESHDQGWTTDRILVADTYRGSKTWFDVGLEKVEVDAGQQDGHSFGLAFGQPPEPLNGNPLTQADDNYAQFILRTYSPGEDEVTISAPAGLQVPISDWERLFVSPTGTLQRNRVASSITQMRVVEWKYNDDIENQELESLGRGIATGDGSFVRKLEVGDVISVWARARTRGWENSVVNLRMDVYWAV